MYLYPLQKEDKILTIEKACIEPGKMLNIFVCANVICQFYPVGYMARKMSTHVSPNFLDTVKKLANASDLSARPATSSITISLSSFIFLLKNFYCFLCLKAI